MNSLKQFRFFEKQLIQTRKALLSFQQRQLMIMNTRYIQINTNLKLNQQSIGFPSYQIRSFAKKEEKSKQKEKKEKEKAQVQQEFEGQDEDTLKQQFHDQLDQCRSLFEDELKQVKSGRAAPDIFDNIVINAYGEKHPFTDLCQTIVKGSNNLLVRVFDESVRSDVLKSLEQSEFDLQCQMEGKDIKVKLGTTKKEHMDAAMKKVKQINETFKKDMKEVRHEMTNITKKLEKILPQDEVKFIEKDFNKLCLATEDEVKKMIANKEKEIKQV